MQPHHFAYDELTPLEQCIASVASGKRWSREDLPTYAEDVPKKEKKAPRTN